ncbi:GTP-binding protein HflX, partial [Fructobacillus durionis]
TLHVPFADSAVVANILDHHELLAQEFDENGTVLTVALSSEEVQRYQKYIQ